MDEKSPLAGKKSPIRTFEDLDVWKICRDLRSRVAELSGRLPREEQYRLRDQLIRASRSVTANLAEGYGRFHYAENMQFARQARGSLYEVLDHLTVARDAEYISEGEFDTRRSDVLRAVALLNGFIRHLAASKSISRAQSGSLD